MSGDQKGELHLKLRNKVDQLIALHDSEPAPSLQLVQEIWKIERAISQLLDSLMLRSQKRLLEAKTSAALQMAEAIRVARAATAMAMAQSLETEGQVRLAKQSAREIIRVTELWLVEGETTRHRALPKLDSFADLEVRFTSDRQVQVSWNGYSDVLNFIELGFEDRRGTERPNKAWRALHIIAQNGGRIDRQIGPKAHQLEKRIEELRKLLRKIFGTNDDPFQFDRKSKSYASRFKISSADPNRF